MAMNPVRRKILMTGGLLAASGIFPFSAHAAPDQISVGWYPGLLGSNFKRSYLDTYEYASTVKLVESFDNARFTQMQANRNRPNLHVGVFTDVLLPLIARSGLVAPLDVKKIPNLADFDPNVVRPVGEFAAPVTYGSWGIAYNSKYVKEPIRGWADLLRDDLKGHVSSPNITYNSSVYTLDAMASLKGGSLRDPVAGMELLHQIRKSGPGLWDQESIAVGWMKTGEIWATPYFSGNVLAMQRDPDLADLRFCLPEEGTYSLPMSVTRVVNPTGGDAPEAFINHMFGVEAQEAFARIGGGRPVNVKAKVPADVAALVPPAQDLKTLDWEYFAEHRAAIVDQWRQIVNR
ncbi:MAG: extracellular solute-binding protein [Alcaligenaceae bacterium]|nr:extracellular solute-binding protein [Alcaligenaceae bacterium]